MDDKKTKKKRSGLPTQMGLIFRIVAGAYLIYLAYSIYTGSGEIQGGEKIAFMAAIVIFVIVGAYIIVTSLRAMQRGEYDGGAADHRKDAEKECVEKEESTEMSGTDRIRFGEREMPETDRIRFGEDETPETDRIKSGEDETPPEKKAEISGDSEEERK